ncbi:MAG: hypothetical protein LBU32_25950 [Clostridiales bacterium]|nr:hypothetical protein [Clostridiales bacterium]
MRSVYVDALLAGISERSGASALFQVAGSPYSANATTASVFTPKNRSVAAYFSLIWSDHGTTAVAAMQQIMLIIYICKHHIPQKPSSVLQLPFLSVEFPECELLLDK